jgi:hypothetical protein
MLNHESLVLGEKTDREGRCNQDVGPLANLLSVLLLGLLFIVDPSRSVKWLLLCLQLILVETHILFA